MGAFALRRPRGRRLLPRAGFIGVGLLAFAIMFPTGEARLRAHQLEIRKECSTQQPERSWDPRGGLLQRTALGTDAAPAAGARQRQVGCGSCGGLVLPHVLDRPLRIHAKGYCGAAASLAASAADRSQRQLGRRVAERQIRPRSGYRDDRGFRGRAASGRMIRAGAPERLFAGCRL